MSTACVITGVGRDRVGIVAQLSEFLVRHGCNLMDSSMTKLRGEFALILMVSVDDDKYEQLKNDLEQDQGKMGLLISVRKLDAAELAESTEQESLFVIRLYGADKAGIVARVTSELAKLSLNITDVQTKMISQGNGDVFVMLLEAGARPGLTEQMLNQTLDPLAKELGVNISAEEIEVMEL